MLMMHTQTLIEVEFIYIRKWEEARGGRYEKNLDIS